MELRINVPDDCTIMLDFIKQKLTISFSTPKKQEQKIEKTLLKETRFFKFRYYLFLIKQFDNGEVEMWAHLAHEKDSPAEYFLGSYDTSSKVWDKGKDYYHLPWAVSKGAIKLHKFAIDYFNNQKYNEKKKRKSPEKRIFTSEDFARWGAMGQKVVIKRTGKTSAKIRSDRIKMEKRRSRP